MSDAFRDEQPIFQRAWRLAAHLPGVEIANYHHFPALKVRGKLLANICREPGSLAVHCPLDLKRQLIEAAPDHFFDTPHFEGWPSILVRMASVDDETLKSRLEAAWLLRAPKAMVKDWIKQGGEDGAL